jgi:hypothetical protein
MGGGELRLDGQKLGQAQLAPDIGNVNFDHGNQLFLFDI